MFSFALLGGCYQPSGVTPCTLTCDQATPCPGELVCGSDGVCHAPGSTACSLIDAGVDSVDARIGDARADGQGFPADCPSDYTISIPSTASTSRYKLLTTDDKNYWLHEEDCRNDVPGATHLATTQTTIERNELGGIVDSMIAGSGAYVYVGAVQRPDAVAAVGGWLWFDGQPVDMGLWASGLPFDAGDGEQNHDAQTAMLDTTMGLIDVTGNADLEAVCECDGIAIDATARTYIDTDPNNPN